MDTKLRTLYPEIEPRMTGMLKVSMHHTIYFEVCGNPEGVPVVVLHGGPGVGSYPQLRRFFDPEKYRIILFDQRGSGKSTPNAGFWENKTWYLVDDMEKIRRSLGVESWLVFGGSWGSTLALAYAVSHPERVKGLVLRGIFLGTTREIDWVYKDGASRIFPDYWEDFIAPIPEGERDDLVAAYYRRLLSGDPDLRAASAASWARWEGRTSTLLPTASGHFGEPHILYAFAFIEAHYLVNSCFFPDKNTFLLQEKNVARFAAIPGVIVEGRYDMLCPMEAAWKLHKAWPSSQLYVSPDAGHSAGEATTTHHLIEATDQFLTLFP